MTTATLPAATNGQPPQPQAALTLRDRLKSPALIAEMGKAMPAHCKPERMARVAMTALTRTPLLAECEQASFFKCLLDLSQWGLEPDGRRAHLIPFRNNKRGVVECQLIIDYKGYVELAYRSGVVKNIHADVVREGDLFAYNLGRVECHIPWFLRRDDQKPEKAGEVFAVYCLAELTGGTTKTECLSRADVEAVRKRSKSANNGPWVTDWAEMAKKTAFRRLSKWLPLSAEILDAMDRDDDKPSSHVELEPARAGSKRIESLGELTAMLNAPTNGNGDGHAEGETAQSPEEADDKNYNAQGEYIGPAETKSLASGESITVDERADRERTEFAAEANAQERLDEIQDELNELSKGSTLKPISELVSREVATKRWNESQLARLDAMADAAREVVKGKGKGAKGTTQKELAGT